MSKTHRDNSAARRKRGSSATVKRNRRRSLKKIPCNICGVKSRPSKVRAGLCPDCIKI